MLVGIDALEQATKRKDRVLPAGAGRPWDAEEDQSLVADFESGTSIGDLAKSHQRTEGAIRSRLMKLGKLESRLLSSAGVGRRLKIGDI